jgi:hypothetical protein
MTSGDDSPPAKLARFKSWNQRASLRSRVELDVAWRNASYRSVSLGLSLDGASVEQLLEMVRQSQEPGHARDAAAWLCGLGPFA